MRLVQRKLTMTIVMLTTIFTTTFIYHKTQSFNKIYYQGVKFLEADFPSRSLPFFESAYGMNPYHGPLIQNLIGVYEQLGLTNRIHFIIQDIENSVFKKNSWSHEEYLDLAYFFYKREYFSLAEIFFKMQIKKKTTLKVQQDLAESLTWQKKYDEAISVYNDIVATGNFTNKIIFNLAECYRLIGDDKMAVKLYDQYIDEK